LRRELPRAISIVYRRPPSPPQIFPGVLRKVTDDFVIIQSRLSVSQPRRVLDTIIADNGYWAIWFVFRGKWFDVGKFYDKSGNWLGYYCDIMEPVTRMVWGSRTTVITDLFLDLWITPHNDYYVLDESEFENAISSRFISRSVGEKARSQLQLLIRKIRRRDFPPSQVREIELLQVSEYNRIFKLASN
jgi:predicted RNA-binding protein associated with RNAse of E/G family